MSVKENGKIHCDDPYGGPCDVGKPCTHKCRKEHGLAKERRRWNKKRKNEEFEEYINYNKK